MRRTWPIPLLVAAAALIAGSAQGEPAIEKDLGPRVPADRGVSRDPEPDLSRKGAGADGPGDPHTTRYAVTFFNIHTKELLPVPADAGPLPSEAVSSFLRCRVTGIRAPMAPELTAVARSVATRFGADRIEVISGFRSSKMNEMLRKKGRQVAEKSQHVLGQALDFHVPGVEARELARAVGQVHRGGIGTYGVSNFVHVDVGRDRRWGGR